MLYCYAYYDLRTERTAGSQMHNGQMHNPNAGNPLTRQQAAEVLGQLASILESDYFRASHRCSRFLEFSVHYVLGGRPIEELKERVIGTEVFERPADYDTSQDNVVRVTANEVRKRLAQYYVNGAENPNPIIHLTPGSYAVSFHRTAEDPPHREPEIDTSRPVTASSEPRPADTPHRSPIAWKVAAACLLTVAALVLLIVYRTHLTADVVQRVWLPVLQSPKPVLICIPQPFVYGVSSDLGIPSALEGKPVQMPYAFVGIGDAFALADIVKVLSQNGREWQLLPGNSTPSEALLAGPVIIIGNRSNKWSRVMTESQRFFFDATEDVIYDRSNPKVKWGLGHLSDSWSTTEDYAVVSRFTNPGSGEPVIAIAGFTIFGTQAAGDFMTNPDLLAKAMQNAPRNWEKRDFQFVLHTKVFGKTPERPTVIASSFQ